MQPGHQAYRAQCAIAIEGPLIVERLKEAVALVVERHEILRTTFQLRSGLKVPLQVVHEFLDVKWQESEAVGWAQENQAKYLSDIFRQQRSEPFDAGSGPIFGLRLLQIAEQHHLLLLDLPAL